MDVGICEILFLNLLICCSITKSCLTLCEPINCSLLGFPVLTTSQSLLKLMCVESVMPSNHLIFFCPLLLLPSIFPIIRTFQWVSSLHQVAKVLELLLQHPLPMNIQDCFPVGLTVWSPCSSRDSQESSPAPQFKSINPLALSFLYGPTLTSTHDHWKMGYKAYKKELWKPMGNWLARFEKAS